MSRCGFAQTKAVAAASNHACLQLACKAAGEDVGGPMAQHGPQVPWPNTCRYCTPCMPTVPC
jgi:hypothetical protein